MKIAKFIGVAMKAMKNPQLLGSLESFHKSLILHLQYLEARQADGTADDFQDLFKASTVSYLEFLKSMGAELKIPAPTSQRAPVSSESL